MIALCSKCYYTEDGEAKKKKLSSKGMSKRQNEINWHRFKAALDGNKDMATNRGFRMRDGRYGQRTSTGEAGVERVL